MLIPPPAEFGPEMVSVVSPWCVAAYHFGSSTPASGAHPTANMAFFYPMAVPVPYLVKRMWWVNGGTLAGNIDAGIYTAAGARVLSTTPIAQALGAINSIYFQDVTDTMLAPGRYYLAISSSLNTTTFWRHTMQGVNESRAMGAMQQASAATLPATATFAQMASSYLPYFGMTSTASP